MRSRKVSATWVRGVLEALAASGLDVAAVCREVDLDHQAILTADAGCPTEKLSALWEVAEARSGNPAIGLVTRGAAQPACFDVVGYAMMSSASLMEALERLQRYLRLLADDHAVGLVAQGDATHAVFQIGDGTQPVPRARYESSFLILLTFCRWMADKVGYEIQLPHEIEWEVAARFPDSRVFPWGRTFDKRNANTHESGMGQTNTVGLYPCGKNVLNLFDLSGNVWEWGLNKHSIPENAAVDESGDSRVLRGGSWDCDQDLANLTIRGSSSPGYRSNNIGFRLLRVFYPDDLSQKSD